MKPIEFLSILSTITNIKLEFLQNYQDVVDIHDFQKTPDYFFPKEVCKNLKAGWFDRVLKIFEIMQNNSYHHLYPGHPKYPSCFYSLEKQPLFLSVQGDLASLSKQKISVVGSRHPTQRALEWMDTHLSPIVKKDIAIVSGAARGIDQKSHSISLRHQKPTIAFLPSGLLQIYPREFQSWGPKIIDSGGALISEYHPEQLIYSHHFHERNRMIAKLGLFLLVCEARKNSGSTMTARLAIENSKTVCVVPGFPSEVSSQGCVDLLFQGAFPIRDHQDLSVIFEAEKMRLSIPNHLQGIDSNH